MEKKGNLLNQLAIISDLLENTNLNSESSTVVFGLDKKEFVKVFNLVQNKYGMKTELPSDTFRINIGKVTFIFNTNNV